MTGSFPPFDFLFLLRLSSSSRRLSLFSTGGFLRWVLLVTPIIFLVDSIRLSFSISLLSLSYFVFHYLANIRSTTKFPIFEMFIEFFVPICSRKFSWFLVSFARSKMSGQSSKSIDLGSLESASSWSSKQEPIESGISAEALEVSELEALV